MISMFFPSGDLIVHQIPNLFGLPFRDNAFLMKHFLIDDGRTHIILFVVVQESLDHSGLCILRHKVLLQRFHIVFHIRREGQEKFPASVNFHCLCPRLHDIFSGAFFIPIYRSLCFLRTDLYRSEPPIARPVKGQESKVV